MTTLGSRYRWQPPRGTRRLTLPTQDSGPPSVPITAAQVTSGTATSSPATTASVTPTSNRLQLIGIHARRTDSTTPADPTVTGCGLTWVIVGSSLIVPSLGVNRHKYTVFRALGASPTTGSLTITVPSIVQIAWDWNEFAGVDTSGSDGSGAIVQAVNADGTGTAIAVTLAAFGSTNNATFGGVAHRRGFADMTVGAGFAKLGGASVGEVQSEAEWRNDNDTSVDATLASSTGWGIVGIEIKRA